MSAADDDTELRDLLIQNLENSGVLNKLKAEMRAAVFLAMEDQDRLENKTPLINQNLRRCLDSRDGRLVASLIVDFLQVFNLDFSLAVFQPEINSLNGMDGRDLVCRELGLSPSDLNQNSPLLLELVRRGRHREKPSCPAEEPSQKQMAHAQKRFDSYAKDQSGCVRREDLKSVFTDLLPLLSRSMLERFISDELRAADRSFSSTVDLQLFQGMYRRLFSQCRSVVVQDLDTIRPQQQSPEDQLSPPPVSKIPRYRGPRRQAAAKDSERALSLGKAELQQQTANSRTSASAVRKEQLDLDLEAEEEGDPDEGDSFFDDPLPKPQKTYGCQSSPIGEQDSSERTNSKKDAAPLREESLSAPAVSPMRRGQSLSDLSVLDDPASDHGSELRKLETPGTRGAPVGSQSDTQRPGSSSSEPIHSRNGAVRDQGVRAQSDRSASLHLDDDVEYDDDFNSHRSDLSKSELSIGEEIEEVSIEGPDRSDKFDETTQDLSVSQLSQSHAADYMEDVA